ncbi:MAG: hypothetical protein IPK64_17625 [bacterium]|nr:hypothetical protein [bacterium]
MKALLAGLVALAVLAGAATGGIDDAARYLGPDRQQSFDAYVAFITSVHAVSRDGQKRLGVSWEAALDNGRRRFEEARTVQDVYYALLSVQRTLRDGHGRFRRHGLPVTFGPAVALDFEVAVRYAHQDGGPHEYVVVRSGESTLPVGATVTGCDSLAIVEYEARLLEWYDRHTPEGFRDFAARCLSYRRPQSLPCPHPGDAAPLAWQDVDGTGHETTLTWRAVEGAAANDPDLNGSSVSAVTPPGRRDPPRFDAQYGDFPLEATGLLFDIHGTRRADTKILRYVSFNYGNEADFPPELAAIARHLREAGARRVLVDVRENAGGAFDPALVGLFTPQPFRIMTKSLYYGERLRTHPEAIGLDPGLELWTEEEARLLRDDLAARPAATWSREIPFFCRTAACAEAETVLRYDGSPGFETVVLCGPATFSSGDMFVTLMKDNGVAKLAGMPSGAGDAPYRWTLDYPLADGTRVTLRLTNAVSYRPYTGGLTVEGNPPALDFPVFPTRANAAAYLDSVLAAVGWE